MARRLNIIACRSSTSRCCSIVLVLLVRLVLDWIPFFNREWRPKGAGLVAAEIVYTVTDPPIKLFRRFIPPLRVGADRASTSGSR